jgi:hypothetical protein
MRYVTCLKCHCERYISYVVLSKGGAQGSHPARPALGTALFVFPRESQNNTLNMPWQYPSKFLSTNRP